MTSAMECSSIVLGLPLHEYILISIAGIILLGFIAQWLAWQIKIPSILFFLLFGIIGGQVSGLIKPDCILGELLDPFISTSVAVILFEGSLGLHWSEIKLSGFKIVHKLISLGVIITWLAISILSHLLLQLSIEMSLLLGAILIVTGPTVITPILQIVRPKGIVGALLKWEGIVIDPIGVMFAVLVFDVVATQGQANSYFNALVGVTKTIIVGSTVGYLAAQTIVLVFKYNLVPDPLKNPLGLTMVIVANTVCDIFQEESGLFAVTVMGIVLANQKQVSTTSLHWFKENLQKLLIPTLFILLSARIIIEINFILRWEVVTFLAILILVIRPIAVFVSTLKSKLKWQEVLFMAGIAPRGIVAAAMVSIFALKLQKRGVAQAEDLMIYVFLVIIITVIFYGFISLPLAKYLKLADINPQGVLFVGANEFARSLASALAKLNFDVLLVDTNHRNIMKAKNEKLNAYLGDIISEDTREKLDLNGIGRMFALTENDQANSLATVYYKREFGRAEVYQVYPEASTGSDKNENDFRGNLLFSQKLTSHDLHNKLGARFQLQTLKLTEENISELSKNINNEELLPLIVVTEKKLQIFAVNRQPELTPGSTLIAIAEYNFWEWVKDKFKENIHVEKESPESAVDS